MTKKQAGSLLVGCAGWNLWKEHAAPFPETGSHLERYAAVFPAVEINSSFYRPHKPETSARWADSVPEAFRFAVKVPPAITHDARLERCGPLLDRFAAEVAGLGGKLGGLLVQLPPSLVHAPRTAATFFSMLRRRFPRVPVACEPRHASWFAPAVDALWERHAIARVAADPAPVAGADVPGGAGRWRYWRLHGSPRMYYSEYGASRLAMFAASMQSRTSNRGATWCIFDNTAHGFSINDAASLQALLTSR